MNIIIHANTMKIKVIIKRKFLKILKLTSDKYVYTEEEIQAYRVPIKFNNKCVNLFIPYRECVRTISPLRALLDPKYFLFSIFIYFHLKQTGKENALKK